MMIQGAGSKTAEPIPTSISQSKMKKRGKIKNWSRKELLMRQKAVIDKVLHVDAKIEDLRNIFSEADKPQAYVNPLGGPPSRKNMSACHTFLDIEPKESVSINVVLPFRKKFKPRPQYSFLVSLRSSFQTLTSTVALFIWEFLHPGSKPRAKAFY